MHLSAEVSLCPPAPNPSVPTETRLFFLRLWSAWTILISWAFKFIWYLFKSWTYSLSELQAWKVQHKYSSPEIEQLKQKRLFPPQVENSESGNLGLLDRNKHASATLPQTLQNTKYTNSKSYIAPRIWRQSIIYNSYEKWSEGRADLRLIYLRNYQANHTNKIWY